MGDLISRSALIAKARKLKIPGQFTLISADDLIRTLQEAPDVDPVRHATWRSFRAGGARYPRWYRKCSECGWTTDADMYGVSGYCPGCGARMDGDEDTNVPSKEDGETDEAD